MIKNTTNTTIMDGVTADNTTWSSSKIADLIDGVVESIPSLVIDDENISERTTFSSAKIETFFGGE